RAAQRTGVEVALLNGSGALVAGSVPGDRLGLITGLSLEDQSAALREFVDEDQITQWASLAPTSDGSWRVVAYLAEHVALAPLASARLAILAGAGGLIGLMVMALG